MQACVVQNSMDRRTWSCIRGINLIFRGFGYENIYLVDFGDSETNLTICMFTKSSTSWSWYRRLAHVKMNQSNRVIKHDLVNGPKKIWNSRRIDYLARVDRARSTKHIS
jgi:hypothetical protein